MNIKKLDTIYYLASTLIILFSLALATSKDLRSSLSERVFKRNKRTLLSVLNYTSQGNSFKIIKVQKARTMYVEVYNEDTKNQSSFNLGKNLNGALFLNGKTTELASYDLDNDGQKEVIVPTLSKNNKNLIFILKFNTSSGTFSLESPISYIDQLSL